MNEEFAAQLRYLDGMVFRDSQNGAEDDEYVTELEQYIKEQEHLYHTKIEVSSMVWFLMRSMIARAVNSDPEEEAENRYTRKAVSFMAVLISGYMHDEMKSCEEIEKTFDDLNRDK